jgi:hypothetical protein
MREVDPIREPAETLLSSALHRLAGAAERNAPADLGKTLSATFRQHHRRRRRIRTARASAIIACLLLVAVLFTNLPHDGARVAQKPAGENGAASKAIGEVSHASAAAPPQNQPAPAARPNNRVNEGEQTREAEAFIPLPAYDASINPSDVRVVRLEVTGSDLMMVGAPVAADVSERRMVADFVVGSDGTPYAVRLVQQQ